LRRSKHTKRSHSGLLEATCRRENIPLTVQRRVIFTALIERDDHPTVDQIFAQVKDRIPGVSRTTVYRTLETLANLGVVRRTHHFAASARFDGNIEQHHHRVCTICGKVADVQATDLQISNLPTVSQEGFKLLDYSVYFEGHCSMCKRVGKPGKSRNSTAARRASSARVNRERKGT
jgi:Fur family peroxide stress response transcriptional regulator